MASIVETIVGDRRIQLGNEEFVRGMSFGSSWGKIRVGCRLAFNGSSSISTCVFLMGVCQGTVNTYNAATCTDFLGMALGQALSNTFTYNGVATPPTYQPPGAGIVKRSGAGAATISGAQNVLPCVSATPGSNRTGIYLDISKASATYTVLQWIPANTATPVDVSAGSFLAQMENEASPQFVASNISGFTTIAYTGAALFDSISLVWNKSSPTVEISDLCVVRFN